jgi:hypothetical protein
MCITVVGRPIVGPESGESLLLKISAFFKPQTHNLSTRPSDGADSLRYLLSSTDASCSQCSWDFISACDQVSAHSFCILQLLKLFGNKLEPGFCRNHGTHQGDCHNWHHRNGRYGQDVYPAAERGGVEVILVFPFSKPDDRVSLVAVF